MERRLERKQYKPGSTIGRLYVDGLFACFTRPAGMASCCEPESGLSSALGVAGSGGVRLQCSPSRMIAFVVLAMASFLATSHADAAIARDIEEKTEELRAAADTRDAATVDKIQALEDAIKRGEKASAGLWSQIKTLEAEKEALENEKRALEKIQVVLTSGLIGALVTALVAIIGVLLNLSRGRAERDLKRLEVLAKAVELEAKGIPVPADIESAYKGHRPVGP